MKIELDENGDLVESIVIPKQWDTLWIREQYKKEGKSQEWFDNLVALDSSKIKKSASLDLFEPITHQYKIDKEEVKKMWTFESVVELAKDRLDEKQLKRFLNTANEKNYLYIVASFKLSLNYD